MKAAQIKKFGNVDVIEIVDIKKPAPAQGQVLVKVHSVSINPVDVAIREGYIQKMMPLNLPVTLGIDFSGTITEIGIGVTDLKVGDEVFGNAGPFKKGSGSFAEFVVAGSTNVARKPKSLNFTESAALPLVGSSAIQAIEMLKIKKGQKVLIRGGGGGIGSIAIQLAKLKGAYVATTVSGDDKAYAMSLGADEVYDYKERDVARILKDYDGVFETARANDTDKLFNIIKKGGILVSIAGPPDQKIAIEHGVGVVNIMTDVSREQLNSLSKLVDGRKIKLRIGKIFKFSELKDAFRYFEKGHTKGKVVIEMM